MNEKEYDFMVGFTLFTPKGFKTMYRHFNNLETAKLFASNKDLKDNCKIYVDLDLYQKEIENNKELEEKLKISVAMLTKGTYPEQNKGDNDFNKQFISKDKIKEKIEEIDKAYEDSKNEYGESEYYYPNYTVKILEELLKGE